MQLTKHFQREEFDCRDGVIVPSDLLPNVQALAENLEILRAHLTDKLNKKGIKGECAIHINSGYRTKKYNDSLAGSAKNSQHLSGRAADITTKYFTPKQVAAAIEELITAKLMKQGGIGRYPGFTHYDIRGKKSRW